ncbi:MAG: hypothetical protein D4R56_04145 [Deltaproteobacteria bacterium]|nr:MAG: hypothetical protein D4R56_04145 [Deltaproteobacteria bacterium]
MKTVSKNGEGKTLYIRLSVFPCGSADPSKNLTISCSDMDTQFKTTLSDNGLRKFREQVLGFYKTHVIEKTQHNKAMHADMRPRRDHLEAFS